MISRGDSRALAHLVLALKDYRNDIVLVGGWAHRLSRLHTSSQLVDFEPLFSEDVDLVLPASVAPREEDLRELLQRAGFTEQLFGERRPPVTHYQLGKEGSFYAEFLTPLIGRPRSGTSTIAGVTVQELRYLDILLVSPWSVFLKEPEYPIGKQPVEVRIANMASYLAQKLLVLNERQPDDRAKDTLYIHDTLMTFGASLSELREIWEQAILPSIHKNAARKLRRSADSFFASVGDLVRRASRIARGAGRPLEAEDIARVCRRGLVEIFG